jgi:hypothetical protein
MKQCGERFTVTHVGLRDTTGAKVNTACHLHVFEDKIQTAVLVRNDSDPDNPIVYTEGAAGEDNEYRAELRFDSPTLAAFYWHFPDIEHVTERATVPIQGPVLTEPT